MIPVFISEQTIICPICGIGDIAILDPKAVKTDGEYTGLSVDLHGACGHQWILCIGASSGGGVNVQHYLYRTVHHEYIRSDRWRFIADEEKNKAGNRCRVCNRHSDVVTLDAHHRTYDHLGLEQDGDITVLCRDCHSIYENARKIRGISQKSGG